MKHSDKSTFVLKIFDNTICKKLLKLFFIPILPLCLTSVIIIGDITKTPSRYASGTVARCYMGKGYFMYYTSKHDYHVVEDCFFIVLNDSLEFTVRSLNDISILSKKKSIIDQYIEVEYEYEMPDKDAYFDAMDGKSYRQPYPYLCVRQIRFENGQKILPDNLNIYILIFIVSFLWVLLYCINEAAKLWKSIPVRSTKIFENDFNSQKHHVRGSGAGRVITKFNKCPACGFKIKDSDNECPDCGLNLT